MDEASCDQPIYVTTRDDLDVGTDEAIDQATDWFELPNGDTILDPLRANETARQLSQGFYYWTEYEGDDEEFVYWNNVRRDFANQLRNAAGWGELYTPGQVLAAMEDGWAGPVELQRLWAEWEDIAGDFEPTQETEWISDAMFDWVSDNAGPDTLVWYSHRAVSARA